MKEPGIIFLKLTNMDGLPFYIRVDTIVSLDRQQFNATQQCTEVFYNKHCSKLVEEEPARILDLVIEYMKKLEGSNG